MKGLTVRQKEILNFIKVYLKEHKYPPTIREIADNFKISVKCSHDHIKALQRKQCIRFNNNRSRTIEIVEKEQNPAEQRTVSIPLLGNVAAGKPLFSEENYDGSVEVPLNYLKSGEYFALSVKGDSMLNAGIHDGDIAIIRQQNVAESGEIVVAMLNDAITLKKLYIEKNRIKLQPANPAYSAIYTKSARIIGKLTYLMRDYEK